MIVQIDCDRSYVIHLLFISDKDCSFIRHRQGRPVCVLCDA